MPETVSCPQCHTLYKAPAGPNPAARIKCKKCGHVFAAAPAAQEAIAERPLPVPPGRSAPQQAIIRPRVPVEPARQFSPVLLVSLLVLGLVGVGGAVGAYFLFGSSPSASSTEVAQNDERDKQQAKDNPSRPGPQTDGKPRPNKDRQPPKPKDNNPNKDKPRDNGPAKDKTPDPRPNPKVEVEGGVVKLSDNPQQILALPDGKTVLLSMPGSGKNPGRLIVLELPSGEEKAQIPLPMAVNDQAILPDGKTLVQGGNSKPYFQLFDLESQKATRTFADQTKPVQSVAVSADGKLAATGGKDDSTVRVWDVESGTEVANFGAPFKGPCNGVLFSPDGKQLFAHGASKTRSQGEVRIWDVANKKEVGVFTEFAGDVHELAVSPDGKLLAASYSGLNRGGLTVFHLPSNKELLKLDEVQVHGVAFGPGGDTVIAGVRTDSTIHIFDLKTGKHAGGFRGHTGFYITQVAVAPGTKTLLSRGVDKTVRLWDLGAADGVKECRHARVTANPAVLVATGPGPMPKPGGAARGQVAKLLPDNRLVLSSAGKEVTVSYTDKTRFFGADGKPLPGGAAARVYRLGNEVDVKLGEDGQAATEMRLVKEGPTELVLEKAQLTGAEADTIQLQHDGKKIEAALGPKSVVKQGTKTLSGQDAKAALQAGKDYWVKLGYDADATVPVVREIRIELVYAPPPETKDDFWLKNATLTLAKESNDFVFNDNGKEVAFKVTKGMLGKRGKDVVPAEEILVPGNRLQVRLRKSGEQNTLVEANLAYEAQTFLFINVPVHVVKGADGKTKTQFVRDANPVKEVRWSAETKGRKLDGTPADPATLFTDKTVVTVYFRILSDCMYVEEVRASKGNPMWDVERFRNCTARVQRDKGKMDIVIHWGQKIMPVELGRGLEAFDAEGQPTSARDLLKDGAKVDVIIGEGKDRAYVLLEVRPAR